MSCCFSAYEIPWPSYKWKGPKSYYLVDGLKYLLFLNFFSNPNIGFRWSKWNYISQSKSKYMYSDPALRSKKAVLISGTFHAINIPAGWKLKTSMSLAGVGTTSRKKQTCHCGRVKYMTERQNEGKAGLLFISFAWIWNSAFSIWVMFWRNLRLLMLFWKSFN